MARIIVDDPLSQISYGGGTWSAVAASHFYGGSATWPDFARNTSGDTGVYGSLNFPFRGTSVAFFGNTPPANNSQWSFFSIDGSPAYNSSFMDPSPSSSRQWYQSPTLPDGLHNIAITHIASTSVDYVVITAGQDTPLLGQVLIVDDDDPSITYGGNWIRDTSTFTSSVDPPVGLPFGNATHQTTSQGASAVFGFTGTGVTVAGIFSFDILGTLSVNYTLDGFSFVQDYAVSPTSPDYADGIKQRENFVLFRNTTLAAGNHVLEIQITNCVNQVFRLDYILYNPSFSTLATKPSLPSIQSSTTSLSTSPTVDPSAPSNSITNKSTPVGAIVGGVVGGIVGLLLLILLLLYRKRLLSRRTPSPSVQTNGTPGPSSLEPFTLASSVTGGTAGLHVFDAKAKTGTSRSPVLGPGDPSSPQTSLLSAEPLSALQQSGTDERHVHRMNRLQDLSEELHRESAAAGGESNNPRVAEVRGRIAELMREESETSSVARSTVIPTREIGNVAPPAYESV